ncbi:hypothetical protein V1504DRAFT_453547 [Lipomyces starkeyi]
MLSTSDQILVIVFLLDAPMSTGKTHSVRECLRINPTLKVISITFGQSLAKYLPKELGLACYLDKDFWVPTTDRSRCVICLEYSQAAGRCREIRPRRH